MDNRAARKQMEDRLAQLNKLIGEQDGVATPEMLESLHAWVIEADHLEGMLAEMEA